MSQDNLGSNYMNISGERDFTDRPEFETDLNDIKESQLWAGGSLAVSSVMSSDYISNNT